VFPHISTALVHLYFADVLWLETMPGIGMKKVFASIEEQRVQSRAKTVEEMDELFSEIGDH
jgi:hypothetical protein